MEGADPYEVETSLTLVSEATDWGIERVEAWQ